MDVNYFIDFFEKESHLKKDLFLKKFETAYVSNDLYHNLFSVQHFFDLLNFSYQFHGFPDTTLIKEGKIIPAKKYFISKANSNKILDLENISHLYIEGCTIKLKQVERFCSQLRILQESATESYKKIVKLNAYLSSCNSIGFDQHYDSHDIFCLQIEGKKEWTFYKDSEHLHDKNVDYFDVPIEMRPKKPTDIIETSKGDILFFPKGMWHSTRTLSPESLHISLGVYNFNLADFFQWASEKQYILLDNELDLVNIFSKVSKKLNPSLIEQYKKLVICNELFQKIKPLNEKQDIK